MRRSSLLLLATLVVPLTIPVSAAGSGGSSTGGGSTISGDFDGDGYEDLAIGVPMEDVRGVNAAGAVHVLYGTRRGLSSRGDQLWHRGRRGVRGALAEFNHFGEALAAGDFDGDRRDDLAIGVPVDAVGGSNAAGSVQVLYGSRGGLTAEGDQVWHRGRPGVVGDPASGAWLGAVLAAGDFDGDGRDDLAVGAPFEMIETSDFAGTVHVFYGSRRGISARGDRIFHQGTPDLEEDPQPDDVFGQRLATGDLGWGGQDELAIGAPGESIGGFLDAGAVHVLRGTPQGLTVAGDQLWHQNSVDAGGDVEDNAEAGDRFGDSLAIANFGRSRREDLAIAANAENLSASNAGAVHVLYGSAQGPTAANDQFWTQDSPGVEDMEETDDFFGWSIVGADFGRSRQADLAAGAANQDVGGVFIAGSVNVLYGGVNGLTAERDQFWTQDSPGVKDAAETPDNLGSSLAAGRYDDLGRGDLAIGVPREGVSGQSEAGAVNVLYSRRRGLTARGDDFWHQDRRGIADRAEADDNFGHAVG